MASLDVVSFARRLIDIDSTTGHEAAAGVWLAERLRELRFTVEELPVDRNRFNVFAYLQHPLVVLSTHYDCVPPFIAGGVSDGRLYGRGACDAKGIVAAQVAAALHLRERGERRVGLLFVVGEERSSDGARAANARAPGSKFLINGEPTGSKLGSATRGVLRLRVRATGRAAHSATPAEGESAIEKLIDALTLLRTLALPSTPELGTTSYNVGLIDGGIAPNVVPPTASAEIVFRTATAPELVLHTLEPLRSLIAIEQILHVPAVSLHTIPGIPSDVFPFTTDIPFLDRWGVPLLFGPGSILVAHSEVEHVAIGDLKASVGSYEMLAARCLQD